VPFGVLAFREDRKEGFRFLDQRAPALVWVVFFHEGSPVENPRHCRKKNDSSSELTENCQKSFVDILSVANRNHEDQQDTVLDLAEDAIVPDSISPQPG
jgi:hypothetical protein